MGQPYDAGRHRVTGDPIAVGQRLWSFTGHGGAAFSASDTGMLAYRTAINVKTQPAWFDRTGRTTATLGEPAEYVHVALSADDKHVALERLDTKTGNGAIWLQDVDRNVTSRFTFDRSWSWRPIWSPDGTSVAFAAAPEARVGIYRKAVSADGNGDLLLESPMLAAPSDWSADGRFLLGTSQRFGPGADMWAISLDGDRKAAPLLETPFVEADPHVSPNGRWLAYSSNESGKVEVYVRGFRNDAGQRQISPAGGSQPLWRRDGRELFYLAADDTVMAVEVRTESSFVAGVPRPLFRPRLYHQLGWSRYDYTVTSDGQRFLVNAVVGEPPAATVTAVVNFPADLKQK